MNRQHAVGCPALHNGTPCTCWIEENGMNWYSISKILDERIKKYPEDPDKIFLKVIEELGEVAECRLKGWDDKLAEEMADVLICWMILARYYKVNLLDAAYAKVIKISKRDVKVINGILVKKEDQREAVQPAS